MAESDIQVGSTVRYVGSHRDVRGSEGMVLEVTTWDEVVVDFGSTVRFSHRDDLVHVRPPKPPTEAPTLNDYDIATDPELVESLSARVFRALASSPKVPLADVGISLIEKVSEIRAAHEVAANHLDHLDSVRQLQCRSAALPESKSGPSIADLGTDVTDEYPLLRGSCGHPGEAPTLNAFDLVEGPDGIIWTVGRQSDDTVELHHQLAGCCYERQRVVRKWPRKGRLGTSTQAQELRQYIASLPSASSLAAVPTDEPLNTDLRAHYERIVHSRLEERLRTGDAVDAMASKIYSTTSKIYSTMLRAASAVDTVWAGSWTGIVRAGLEYGPGIAALNLQAPPRPRRRHQTTSWDPDMPLPDAEPGRYGWLP